MSHAHEIHRSDAAAIGRCLITHWERLTDDRVEPDGLPTLAGDLAGLGPAWIALAGELARHEDVFPARACAQFAELSARAAAGRSVVPGHVRAADRAQIVAVADWLEEYSGLEAQYGLCSIMRGFATGGSRPGRGGTTPRHLRAVTSPMEPARDETDRPD